MDMVWSNVASVLCFDVADPVSLFSIHDRGHRRGLRHDRLQAQKQMTVTHGNPFDTHADSGGGQIPRPRRI